MVLTKGSVKAMARKPLTTKQEIARDLRTPRWIVSRPAPRDYAPDMSDNDYAALIRAKQHVVARTYCEGPSKLPAKFIPAEPVSTWTTRKERDRRSMGRLIGTVR
jgi:hypothetical protein